ncbi:MAG: Dna2/Cas4 domain-containing protein [Methanocellales archaeon]|nr:Dna2/Cas4 domain-containing protein [Methanocellales archaeon]
MTVRASDIVLYMSCPRQAYFVSRGYKLDRVIATEYVEHLLLKELAYRFPLLIKNDDLGELPAYLNDIANDAQGDLSAIEKSQIMDAISNIDVDGIIAGMENAIGVLGKDVLLQRIVPWKKEYLMHSRRLDMSGRPDKLVLINGEILPSIIKTGNKPEYGVWKDERIQLAAYALLVKETFNNPVNCGLIEYARYGEFRDVNIKHADKRIALRIKNGVQKVIDGPLPDKPRKVPCESCAFIDLCRVKKSLLSSLF